MRVFVARLRPLYGADAGESSIANYDSGTPYTGAALGRYVDDIRGVFDAHARLSSGEKFAGASRSATATRLLGHEGRRTGRRLRRDHLCAAVGSQGVSVALVNASDRFVERIRLHEMAVGHPPRVQTIARFVPRHERRARDRTSGAGSRASSCSSSRMDASLRSIISCLRSAHGSSVAPVPSRSTAYGGRRACSWWAAA